jgi:hypothetical protein
MRKPAATVDRYRQRADAGFAGVGSCRLQSERAVRNHHGRVAAGFRTAYGEGRNRTGDTTVFSRGLPRTPVDGRAELGHCRRTEKAAFPLCSASLLANELANRPRRNRWTGAETAHAAAVAQAFSLAFGSPFPPIVYESRRIAFPR